MISLFTPQYFKLKCDTVVLSRLTRFSKTWHDIEWESMSLENARKLADTIFGQYELAGGENCVLLMMVFDPEGQEDSLHGE